jgi:site-specific recombinase XerD
MLTDLFESGARIQALRAGPNGALFDAFADSLAHSGYSPLTARGHLRAAEHFAHWADRTGWSIVGPIGPALERFNRHLQRAGGCPRFGHTFRRQILHGARLFLMHLQGMGVDLIERPTAKITVPMPPLIAAFYEWMQQQRGTCTGTLSNYEVHLRELLIRLGDEPSAWDARGLRQFVLESSRTCGWAKAKKRTTALRMFLRFLIAEGRCASQLEGAVPVLAHWRLSSLPRYLTDAHVERVIASCDSASGVGKRDRAILLLLARLGLRAGDIVQMRLNDIDWKGARVQVSGKGRHQTRLPLSQEVGDALFTYLARGRPPTDTDAVFVRSRAPFRAFRSHCAVSVIVDRALTRAGVTRPSRGAAHLLRHSLATSLLQRGASMPEISALLRHRSITTTEIYAKVDIRALGRIAQPWPEVQPC